ncbi:MAG: hypothetical protein MRJ65_04005 [Candidatus Brocadiaceae bacterium]|nr:hypothetical protein [Candidatus Brocadiaceae bacterium]
MDRMTPRRMINDASEFFDAANILWPANTDLLYQLNELTPFVVHYLIGHSIELSLKSFLLSRGLKINELRSRKYGHDLSALLIESRRRKLGKIVKLTQREIKAINLLNVFYKDKLLEYTEIGFYSFPPYTLINCIADKLHSKVRLFCGLRPFRSKFKTSIYFRK